MYPMTPLPPRENLTDEERCARARSFADSIATRRSVRDFASTPVPRALIEDALRAAGSAPSGANQQPWRFVAVQDPAVKRQLREASEEQEQDFYQQRAPEEWLMALAPFGLHSAKPFLEEAPWLIVVTYERFGYDMRGERVRRYHPVESTAIATGFMLAAFHQAGLATLLYVPGSMEFVYDVLGRSRHETPFGIVVVGHPGQDCRVPDVPRLKLSEYASFL